MARGFWNVLGEIVPCTQDFEGQKRAQRLFQVLILTVTVRFTQLLGFIVSCVTKQFMYTGWAAVASTVLSIVLVTPNWPYLNKDPISWASDKKKN